MATRYQVGSSFKSTLFISLAVISAGDTLVTVALLFLFLPLGLIFSVGTAALWIATAICIGVILRNRVTVEIAPDSFTVTDRSGTHEYQDDDVIALAIDERTLYSQGIPEGTRRIYRLRTANQPPPAWLCFQSWKNVDAEFDLSALYTRLKDKLHARWQAGLDRGQRFAGTGWELTRDGLHITAPAAHADAPDATSNYLRFDQIAAFDFFEAKLCIWARGTEHPALRVPAASLNLPLLLSILTDRVPVQPENPAAAGTSLGRILFERNLDSGRVVLWLFAGIFFLAGVGMVGISFLDPFSLGVLLACASPALVGLLLGWGAFEMGYRKFRAQVFGVSRVSRTRQRNLRFTDLAHFQFDELRTYYNDAYTGTKYTLTFVPRKDVPGKKMVFATTLRHVDEEMARLRTHIANVMAKSLREDLEKNATIDWTPIARITDEGIQYRPQKFLGRGDWTLAPYDDIAVFTLTDGTCDLKRLSTGEVAVKIPCGGENFYPGLVLMKERYPDLFEDTE